MQSENDSKRSPKLMKTVLQCKMYPQNNAKYSPNMMEKVVQK